MMPFGCPFDAFEENNDNDAVGGTGGSNTKWKVKDGFPEGILRLIQHPYWISRGCSIPTTATCQRGYNEWANLADGEGEDGDILHRQRNISAGIN